MTKKGNKKYTNNNANKQKRKAPTGQCKSTPAKKLKKDLNEIEVLETIIPKKSNHDPNSYRILKLSNGLTVMLISNKAGGPRFNGFCRRSLDMNLFPSSRFFLPSTCPTLKFQPEMNIRNNSIIPSPSHRPFRNSSWNENFVHYGTMNRRAKVSRTCVALTVSVGFVDDPFETQGLAHFMEHMVHHGSESFPDAEDKLLVNTFREYNAATSSQSTSYYNTVPDNILDRNLSVFVDMLAKPLFTPEMLALEVNAVDSECYLKYPALKIHFLVGYIAVVNKRHPLVRFLCGNLETLTDCVKQNGKEMQKKMMTHHKTNYVPSAMTAAINSKKSIDELEKLVLHHFKNFCPAKDRGAQGSLLHDAQLQELPQLAKPSRQKGYLYAYLEGNYHSGYIVLSWHLDASVFGVRNSNEENQKVKQMMHHLLSNTSEGSLFHHLIRERLIISISVQLSRTRYSSQIKIYHELTEKGRENTAQVIEETLAYIKKLSGDGSSTDEDRIRMKQHFGDIRVAKLSQFHYGSQEISMDLTERLAISLQYEENLREVLRKDSWYHAIFNYESVTRGFKAMLNKNNLMIMEILPSGVQLRTKCNKAEIQPPAPYVNAVYAVTTKPFGKERKTEFRLPQENLLIKEIKIAEKYEVDGAGDREFGRWMPCMPANYGNIKPHRLNFKSAKISGYHEGHKEVSNNRYACQVYIDFHSSYTSQIDTPRIKALMLLWAAVVDKRLLTKRSGFQLAGYRLTIYNDVNDMSISVGGFPTHLVKILKAILDEMLDDKPVTHDEFGLAHECTKAHAATRTANNDYIIQSILDMLPYVRSCPASASSYDLFEVLDKITLADLQVAIKNFKRSASCFVTLCGNVSRHHFVEIANILEKKKFGQVLDNSLHPEILPSPKVFSTPGETCMRIINQKSPEYTTSVTNLYVMGYKTGKSKEHAFIELCLELLKKQAFTYLRTEAQLGYVVYAERAYQSEFEGSTIWGFMIHVKSTAKNFTACEIDKKIDEFLAQFGDSLKNLQEYEEIVNMFKKLGFGYDKVTKDELGDWFNSIFGPEFHMDQDQSTFNKCTLRGIQKLSIQVLSGNPDARTKECHCPRCSSQIRWIPGNGESLLFAKAVDGIGKDYFVNSPLS